MFSFNEKPKSAAGCLIDSVCSLMLGAAITSALFSAIVWAAV